MSILTSVIRCINRKKFKRAAELTRNTRANFAGLEAALKDLIRATVAMTISGGKKIQRQTGVVKIISIA